MIKIGIGLGSRYFIAVSKPVYFGVTIYNTCSDWLDGINGSSAYIKETEYILPLVNGTKVYSDSDGLIEITNTSFVQGGYGYTYDPYSGGGTVLSVTCDT
jgi:hypothetical protein